MIKIGVCLETVFTDIAYAKRASKVADLGFSGISFWHYDQQYDGVHLIDQPKDIRAIERVVRERGLEVTNFLVNSPDGSKGGSLVRSGGREEYLDRIREIVPVAQRMNCTRLTTCSGNRIIGVSEQEQHRSIVDTLGEASNIVEDAGITLMIEPVNSLIHASHKGHRGVFLDSVQEGVRIIREIGHKNIQLLFDIYHMQTMGENIISAIESNVDIIALMEGAGVPGRGELWLGKLDYPSIIRKISKIGYEGYLSLEYLPTMDSWLSLKMTKEYLNIPGVVAPLID